MLRPPGWWPGRERAPGTEGWPPLLAAVRYAVRGWRAYPLVLATYEIVCSKGYDPATSAAVRSMLTVAADNAQDGLSAAGYVPLPDKFKKRLIAAINAIR